MAPRCYALTQWPADPLGMGTAGADPLATDDDTLDTDTDPMGVDMMVTDPLARGILSQCRIRGVDLGVGVSQVTM